jgi:hypothetical protein
MGYFFYSVGEDGILIVREDFLKDSDFLTGLEIEGFMVQLEN